MNAETQTYLQALFEGMPEGAFILIWAKRGQTKLSKWANSVSDAVRAVESIETEDGWDIYAGVCTSPRDFGKNRRVSKDDVLSLATLWVDLDIAGPGHASGGKKYARDEAEALALIDKIGLAPSLIVHTGGGIHAYWLLKEHWIFGSDAERHQAQILERAFIRTFQLHGGQMGIAVDSVFDLARVMRLPGTSNWKNAEPRLARILQDHSDIRYDPADLQALLPPEAFTEQSTTAIVAKQIGNLILDPQAEPPLEKMQALQLAEPKFDASVKYQRKDFPKGKDSPSEYDLSLATFAAMAGWSEQEIADLLLFVRRLHGKELKLENAQYYRRTINMAVSDAQRCKAVEELRAEGQRVIGPDGESVKPSDPNVPPEEKRRRRLEWLSQVFACKIMRITKYLQDPPRYRMETELGGIELGEVDSLINQTKIRNAMAAVNGHLIKYESKKDWEGIAQGLLDACEPVSTGVESSDTGQLREWLLVYLDETAIGELDNAALVQQTPIKTANGVIIFLSHFRNYLYTRFQEKRTAKELGPVLRRINAEPTSVSVDIPAENGSPPRRSTRHVWNIPLAMKGSGDDI